MQCVDLYLHNAATGEAVKAFLDTAEMLNGDGQVIVHNPCWVSWKADEMIGPIAPVYFVWIVEQLLKAEIIDPTVDSYAFHGCDIL